MALVGGGRSSAKPQPLPLFHLPRRCASTAGRMEARVGERILRSGTSRLEPLNRSVLCRNRKSGAKAGRTPNAARRAEVVGGRDSVWSARVFSTAFGPGFMESSLFLTDLLTALEPISFPKIWDGQRCGLPIFVRPKSLGDGSWEGGTFSEILPKRFGSKERKAHQNFRFIFCNSFAAALM